MQKKNFRTLEVVTKIAEAIVKYQLLPGQLDLKSLNSLRFKFIFAKVHKYRKCLAHCNFIAHIYCIQI